MWIISYRGAQSIAQFLISLQKGLGSRVNLSTAINPQFYGQGECTIHTLKDMFRACVINFKGNLDDHLPLIEFVYNISYPFSIPFGLYESLYARKCRSHNG